MPPNSGFEHAASTTEDGFSDNSLDEILARKSGLAFLCKVNADYKEIERYLSTFPEALLFGYEDSDLESVVTTQMRACTCFGKTCNQNRRLILRALGRGFEFYRGIRLVDPMKVDFFNNLDKNASGSYNVQLRDLERDLRMLHDQETMLNGQIVEMSQAISYLRLQIEQGSRGHQSHLHSQLKKLQCRKVKTHAFEERTSAESKLATATLAIVSLEEDRRLLQTETTAVLRLQHAFLKKSFSGCRRHICDASKHEL